MPAAEISGPVKFLWTRGPPRAAAQFSLSFTVAADSTMDDNDGFLLRITGDSEASDTVFAFEEEDKVRLYAIRNDGGNWDIPPDAIYICQASSMSPGDSWNFLPINDGQASTATVVGTDPVSGPAGSYNDAIRVDIRLAADGPAGEVKESRWFVEDLGYVKTGGYFGGEVDFQDRLESSSVTGIGFFPLEIGNSWTYLLNDGVGTAALSFGALKASP